jgi:hypothetical protein
MNRVEQEFVDAERKLETLSSLVGSWRQDHELATICQDFESLLLEVNTFFTLISKLDTRWHSGVFSGVRAYDAQQERKIAGYYRRWSERADVTSEALTYLEGQGYHVSGAESFRANVEEARGILTPDAEFFDDAALAKRQDEAIEAHHGGETVEFEEMGD